MYNLRFSQVTIRLVVLVVVIVLALLRLLVF